MPDNETEVTREISVPAHLGTEVRAILDGVARLKYRVSGGLFTKCFEVSGPLWVVDKIEAQIKERS